MATVTKLLTTFALLACMWDTDTLRMETEQFPEIRELLAGHFVRHSRAYYEWRIRDRKRRLTERPGDVALQDDLAVAYEKVGRTDDAIALARAQLASHPDRYETHANLGTFLVHAGRLEEGVQHLSRAVAINPDAHFGREPFQIELVRYVIAVRGQLGRTALPLRPREDEVDREHPLLRAHLYGFNGFVSNTELPLFPDQLKRALRAVAGMMFFGRHDSPVLCECLGDLLTANGIAAQRLATRAYLKASYAAESPEERAAYREAAKRAIDRQHEVELAAIEEKFREERKEGEAYAAAVAADEARWIAAGGDVDAQFAAKYYRTGKVASMSVPVTFEEILPWLMGAGILLLPVLILYLRDARRRARGRMRA